MKPILLDLPQQIQTPRLFLRPPQPGDGKELNAAIIDSLAELQPWMPWAQSTPSILESEENVRQAYAKWILREDLRYSIFEKASGKMVGSTGLHRILWDIPAFEIGYWVRTPYQGQGFITEAVNALTRFSFAFLKAKRAEIRCNARNVRSLAVMKRLNFEFEGCLRGSDAHVKEGESRDTLVYSRLNLDGLPPLEVQW